MPLTIVGAFSEGAFPDDVTLIAPEALFRQVAGDQSYNMVGVQLDRTADEDTLFTLADLATDDVIMQDLRESNRQDRGTITRCASCCTVFWPSSAASRC